MEIGVQLYTLRDLCTSTEGLADTLAKVADIGYRNVQLSGVCAYDPVWMKDELRKNGLRVVLTHVPPTKFSGELPQILDDHKILDCPYIGIGCMPGKPGTQEAYDRFVEAFTPIAEKMHDAGAYLMYHNHHFEFMKSTDGRIFLERLAEAFPKDCMGITLDTYWVQYGGGDPAYWLQALSGRVPCIHLKDMSCVEGAPRMAPIGEGNLNFDRIFEKAESAGTKYMLVEQDSCYGEHPLDCLQRSYEYLKSCGFN